MESHINIGCGSDISIAELAHLVAEVTGFEGEILFDTERPDGPPRKLLDVTRLTDMGWKAQIPLKEGIEATYQWFLTHCHALRQQ
jgi:nucleoside-diphosphate-sugar epimerase